VICTSITTKSVRIPSSSSGVDLCMFKGDVGLSSLTSAKVSMRGGDRVRARWG
jgi:hypothetical protein